MAENGKSLREKEENQDKGKCVFGEYEPSGFEDQTTKNQLVSRCASQNSGKLKEEPHSKSPPPARNSPVREARTGCDPLTLEDEVCMDFEPQTSPAADRQPVPANQLLATEDAAPNANPPKEEEDWLSAALARKKAQAQVKALEALGKGLDACISVSQPDASTRAPQQSAAPQDKEQSTHGSRLPDPHHSIMKEASAELLVSAKADPSKEARHPDGYPAEAARASQRAEDSNLKAQNTYSQTKEKCVLEDDLFNKLEETFEFLELNAAESHLQPTSSCLLALLHIQAHVSQLETQVSTVEMKQEQHRQFQELLQLRHQEDMDLIAHAHRRQMKVVDDGQQEERLQQNEQPEACIPLQRKDTAPAQQLSMSQEQDKQLEELQDRLSQQQRDMAEERSQFQEAIDKLKAGLSEQTQLLEQEQRKGMAYEAKVESLQCSLEELQQFMRQQLSLKQEEMERLKNTLLKKQKSVLQKCSEKQGKLEAEWTEFHTREKLRKEWLEQKMEQSQKMNRTRMRLAKEQAELTLWDHKLRAKEEQLERDGEQLDEFWHNLELKNEKVNRATQRIQKKEKEIKSMIERSSQKCRAGKRALREARRLESEHQDRLQAMQTQLEQLRQNQELLRQDWLSVVQQRRQLEQLCSEAWDFRTPIESTQSMAPPSQACFQGRIHPQHSPWRSRGNTASSSVLHATLQMLKHRAQMEWDFLESERIFLESLKKTPNTT